jgi:hypothetical protein
MIWCSGWRTGTGRPLCFEVRSVDVFVDLKKSLQVPVESLGHAQWKFFSARERSRFAGLAARGETLATDALEWWLRVLRWKSLRPSIGRPEISRGPARGVYLVDYLSKRRFYAGPISLLGSASEPLSKLIWRRTESALNQGREPPVWIDFLLEGEHRLAFDDRSGSVMHLAIAAESLLRHVVAQRHARTPPHDEFLAFLNQVSVSRIIDRWKHLGFSAKGWTNAIDLPAFKRLFELRNRLMHRGDSRLDAAECRGLASAVRTFVQRAG